MYRSQQVYVSGIGAGSPVIAPKGGRSRRNLLLPAAAAAVRRKCSDAQDKRIPRIKSRSEAKRATAAAPLARHCRSNLRAVVHVEFNRMRGHAKTRHLFHLQRDV